MKKLFFVNLLAAVLLAGCGKLQPVDYATKYEPNRDGAGKKVLFSGETLIAKTPDELVQYSFAMERMYQDLAIQADQVNHAGNGLLMAMAFGIGLNNIDTLPKKVIEKRLLVAFGLNEGFKYSNPAQLALAFRKASSDSLCIATTAGTGEENREARGNGSFNIWVVAALRASHGNLRQRMSRPRYGLKGFLDAFDEQKFEAIQVEDGIKLANKVLTLETKDQFGSALFKCLN